MVYLDVNAGGVTDEYKGKLRSLMFNLKDANNPDLRGHVLGGQIPPAELVRMSADNLANKELTEWRKKRLEEHDKEIVLDVETAAKVR